MHFYQLFFYSCLFLRLALVTVDELFSDHIGIGYFACLFPYYTPTHILSSALLTLKRVSLEDPINEASE